MFLQEDSQKSIEMRLKMRGMLLSEEESNLELALQLIESGGMHSDFVAPLWIQYIRLKQNFGEQELAKTTKKFLLPFLTAEQKIIFNSSSRKYLKQKDKRAWDHILAELADNVHTAVFLTDLAVCGLQLLQAGGLFCLQNDILAPSTVYKQLVSDTELDLSGYHLQEIPSELAQIQVQYLNLRNNPIEKLPAKKWSNPFVIGIDIDLSISPKIIRGICSFFPNAIDKSYYSLGVDLAGKAVDYQQNNDMLNARKVSEQAIHFFRRISKKDRDRHYYHARARTSNIAERYHIALACYEHIIQTEEDYNDCLYNMACNQARIGNKEKTLEYLERDIQYKISKLSYSEFDRKYILGDNDFEPYWKDEDFNKLIESYIAEESD